MEAVICISTPKAPDVPPIPERQPVKLADDTGFSGGKDARRKRRAMIAGLVTSPQGVTGTASTAAPSSTLG